MGKAKVSLLTGEELHNKDIVCVPASYKGAQGKMGFVGMDEIKTGYQIPAEPKKGSGFVSTELKIKFRRRKLPFEYNGFLFRTENEITAFVSVITKGRVERKGAIGDFLIIPPQDTLCGFRYIYSAVAQVVKIQTVEVLPHYVCNTGLKTNVTHIQLVWNNTTSTKKENIFGDAETAFDSLSHSWKFKYTTLFNFMRGIDLIHRMEKDSEKPKVLEHDVHKASIHDFPVDKRGGGINDMGKRAK